MSLNQMWYWTSVGRPESRLLWLLVHCRGFVHVFLWFMFITTICANVASYFKGLRVPSAELL